MPDAPCPPEGIVNSGLNPWQAVVRQALRRLATRPASRSAMVLGLALGIFGAFALGGLFRHHLNGALDLDLGTFASALILLAAASLAAAMVPALRAASTNPAAALKED